jgi:hypothetical protein
MRCIAERVDACGLDCVGHDVVPLNADLVLAEEECSLIISSVLIAYIVDGSGSCSIVKGCSISYGRQIHRVTCGHGWSEDVLSYWGNLHSIPH